MKELNKDIKERDKLIFGKYRESTYKMGGIRHFEDLDVKTLGILLEKNFVDPDDCQNYAPSISAIYEFMKMYPDYKAHGYAVTDKRDDYRVSIEGVAKGHPAETVEEYSQYMELFRNCDEFNNRTMYCWFD